MNSKTKIIVFVLTLSAMPLFIIVIWNFVIYRKGWDTAGNVRYDIVFFGIRLLLAPLVMFYTLRYWFEINRLFKILIVHVVGFTVYTSIIFGLSFVLLKNLLPFYESNRSKNLFNGVINNSLTVNLLIYVVIVFMLYVGQYFELTLTANKKANMLEKSMALSMDETLKNQSAPYPLSKPSHLSVKNGSKTHVIQVNDIMYLAAYGQYIRVVCREKVCLIKQPLYKFEKTLAADIFIRVHRSFIVNINFVKEIRSLLNGDYDILLKNGEKVRASRTYREAMRAAFGTI